MNKMTSYLGFSQFVLLFTDKVPRLDFHIFNLNLNTKEKMDNGIISEEFTALLAKFNPLPTDIKLDVHLCSTTA